MVSSENHLRPLCYRAEISGWDMDEIFFVENAEIAGGEQTEKRVKLRRPLRKGAIVFVRHLLNSGAERDCPTAYEVEPMAADENGYCEYRLSSVRSRTRPNYKMVH